MIEKKCKQCNTPFICYNTIQNLCWPCMVAKNKQKPLKAQKSIKKISSKNKNTPAKFSIETKAIIKARDKKCILCPKDWLEYHHAYFWPIQANYWPNRNDADQWVFLCHECHHEIHHWNKGKWKLYRMKCIEYLLTLK